jgi:hypothetical protein
VRGALVVVLLAVVGCGKADVLPAASGDPTTTVPPTTTTTIDLPALPDAGLAMDLEGVGVVLLDLAGREVGVVPDHIAFELADLLPQPPHVDEPDLAPLDRIGHWQVAFPEPGGRRQLALWSGECESPSAWVVEADGSSHPVRGTSLADVPESYAMGWAPDGRAIVSFTEGICGKGSQPGVYLIDLDDPAASPFHVTPLVVGTYFAR